ncbi:MAG TPA: CDP-alcohol phosphatidyltransferase family protein [Chloroflexia bacterium]|nr:CDP-alcohol phosphatidyltransferase family protein [Chloroflexia bacterium]
MFKYFRVPDLFTCAALIVALTSIYLSISGFYALALGVLPLAALLDMLDGFAARSMGRQDKFGRELDSLVDMVAYGLAPSVFWLAVSHRTLLDFGVATLLPLALAIRLANFNIKQDDEVYLGLPSGWNAWLLPFAYFLGLAPFFPILFTGLALLMVAPVPIPKLDYRMEHGKLAIGFHKS